MTNVWDDNVAVVNLKTLRVVAHVRVGMEPNGVSFSALAPAKPPATLIHLPLKTGMEMG